MNSVLRRLRPVTGGLTQAVGRDRSKATTFEEVSPGAHGAYDQTQGVDPLPQPEHVDVQGVAPGSAVRPRRPGESLATHHRPEPVDYRHGESGLDWRKWYRGTAEAQKAITVQDRRRTEVTAGPAGQGGHPGPDVDLRGRYPDPVLEAVKRL
jgi:hypothetical protein